MVIIPEDVRARRCNSSVSPYRLPETTEARERKKEARLSISSRPHIQLMESKLPPKLSFVGIRLRSESSSLRCVPLRNATRKRYHNRYHNR